MATSKCQSCGYRCEQSARACANCGRSLVVVAALPASPAPASGKAKGEQTLLLAPPQPPAQVALSPRRLSPARVEPAPLQRASPLLVDDPPGDPLADAQSERRLPPLFALTRPQLEGTVVAIDTREQTNDFPDIGGALVALLAELIWVVPNSRGGTTREGPDRVEVTRLRVQTDDGTRWDATLRGSLRGANLAMGDDVSLWGRKRQGNLQVHRGYDHTSRSPINTRGGRKNLFPFLLLLCAVIVLYLYVSTVSPRTALQQVQGIFTWFMAHLPRLRTS